MRPHILTALLTISFATAAIAADPASPATSRSSLPFTIAKETTAITSPLRPNGTPDFLAALNEKYGHGVTADQNAVIPFLLILGTDSDRLNPETRDQTLRQLGLVPGPATPSLIQSYSDFLLSQGMTGLESDIAAALANAHKHVWTAKDDPLLAAYLQSQAKALNLAVQASLRPRWFFPYVSTTGSLQSVEYFHFQGVAQFGNLLCARAMLRASSGDMDGALADILATRRLARLWGANEMLLAAILGVLYEDRANETLAALITSGTLTEKQCATLARALDIPPLPPLVDDTLQRWTCLDLLIRKATGQLPQSLLPNARSAAFFNSIDSSFVDWDVLLTMVNAWSDRQCTLLRLPSPLELNKQARTLQASLDGWQEEFMNDNGTVFRKAQESRADYTQRVAHAVLAEGAPVSTLGKSVAFELRRRETALRSQMLSVLLAAARIKAAKGAWSESLTLDDAPSDPFTSPPQPVRYLLQKHGPIVYSVGPNGQDESGADDDVSIGFP